MTIPPGGAEPETPTAVHAATPRARLTGVGGYLPARIVSNDTLAQERGIDTTDAWIRERTGIIERRFAGPDDTAVSMATEAARVALADAALDPAAIDLIIVATATPDEAFPATAVRVQAALGVTAGFAFDVAAACSGFIYALATADAFIRAGQAKNALVIGSEVYSRILNWQDRGTCVLFGDGAGAVVLQAGATPGQGLLSVHLHSDGRLGDLLYVDGAVGRPDRPGHLVMKGQEVFRHAVAKLAGAVDEALAANNLTYADIGWLVPHQANRRIIEAMARRLSLPPGRAVVTVEHHANTSAASIPLALWEARQDGRIKPGELILMEALGGGMTWGSALVRL